MLKVFFTSIATTFAQIHVLSPDTLRQQFRVNDGQIFGSTATFGAPYYGERVIGEVYWARSDLGLTHCSESDYTHDEEDENKHHESKEGEEPATHRIVLVRRGDCTFTAKVRIAEQYVQILNKENDKTSAGKKFSSR